MSLILKLKKDHFNVARCILIVLLGFTANLSAENLNDQNSKTKNQKLIFLNWSQYLDPELVKEFEQQFNAEVSEVYFETSETMNGILAESGGRGYDLVLMTGIQVDAYRSMGWLAPITEKQIPNLRHVGARWRTAYIGVDGFSVPYFWGTLGIGYRSDLVLEKPTTWKHLFNPPVSLHGKILMLKDSRDLIGIALKALGYSPNTNNLKELAEAEHLLTKQKPYVKDYGYIEMSPQSRLITGQIWVSMMYSGDVLFARKFHPNIEYVIPEEGANLWVDYLVILKSSSNKKLAMAFINFLNEPKNAARLATYVHYLSPNTAAEKYLPKKLLEDPVLKVTPNQLKRSEFNKTLPPRIVKEHNRIFAQIIH